VIQKPLNTLALQKYTHQHRQLYRQIYNFKARMAPKNEGSSSGEESSSGSVPKTEEDYLRRRERNNHAVKKSREKTKAKTKAMMDRVEKLRDENTELEANIEILTKELGILKDLFVAHAGEGISQSVLLNELGPNIKL